MGLVHFIFCVNLDHALCKLFRGVNCVRVFVEWKNCTNARKEQWMYWHCTTISEQRGEGTYVCCCIRFFC